MDHPTFTVIVECGENSFGASSPEIPGCVAAGASIAETLRLFGEAVTLHFDAMAADGDALPVPVTAPPGARRAGQE